MPAGSASWAASKTRARVSLPQVRRPADKVLILRLLAKRPGKQLSPYRLSGPGPSWYPFFLCFFFAVLPYLADATEIAHG